MSESFSYEEEDAGGTAHVNLLVNNLFEQMKVKVLTQIIFNR